MITPLTSGKIQFEFDNGVVIRMTQKKRGTSIEVQNPYCRIRLRSADDVVNILYRLSTIDNINTTSGKAELEAFLYIYLDS